MLPSIQISVTVSEKELSLSELYQCLLGKSNMNERSQLVRQVLFDQQKGNPFDLASKEGIFPHAQSGVKVRFSIKPRDIGFEFLYHELASMCTSSERNRHVRKLLYQACQSASQRTEVGQKSTEVIEAPISVASTQIARQESMSSIHLSTEKSPMTPEQAAELQAEKKARRHKQNIEAMKQ